MSFEGEHVVITGGLGALGAAVVAELRRHGAICHVADQVVAKSDDDLVHVHAVDVTKEAEVQAFFAALPDLSASIHVVGGFAMAPLAETHQADFEKMIALNLTSCFLCCRAAAPKMPNGGRIVNVASRNAVVPSAGTIAYATSKAGVAALTENLAVELRDQNILVNAVLPGMMNTPANRRDMPDADHDQWVPVDDVARHIAFLASSRNTAGSGGLIPIYGRS